MTVDAAPGVSVAEVRGWLSSHRHGRRRTASDWYVAIFGCVLVGVMLSAGLGQVSVPLMALWAAPPCPGQP